MNGRLLSTAVTRRVQLLGYSVPRVLPVAELLPQESTPRVSVVIPCYNYGRYLPGCVASVLDQVGVDVDVTIVDDCSTDDSRDVIAKPVAADDRVRSILHDTNKGHIRTYNDGLAQVDGDFVVLLSADDVLAQNALTRAVALMQHNPSVGLVYGGARDFEGDEPPEARTVLSSWMVWKGADWLTDRCRTGRNALRSPEAVMRTDVLRAVGPYRADLPHAADFYMWMAAARVSDVGYLAGVDQAFYRVHAGNMHHTLFGDAEARYMLGDLNQRQAVFQALLGSSQGEGTSELLAMARRSLAAEALDAAIRWYWWGTADDWPTDDLVAFAREHCPPNELRTRWSALTRRQQRGASGSRRNLRFYPRERIHYLRTRSTAWRWEKAGL